MSIRVAAHEDVDAIASIYRDAMREPPYDYDVSLERATEGAREYLEKFDVRVALRDESVVGFIAVFAYRYIDGLRLWISELHVSQQYRSQGIGGELLLEVEREYSSKGAIYAELLAYVGASAEEFYKHRGYHESRQRKFEKQLARS